MDDDGDAIEELAGETVASALNIFKFKVRMEGKWKRGEGG